MFETWGKKMRYEVISRPTKGLIFPKIISLDTEYSEKNIRKANLLSISIGVSPELTYILENFNAVKPFIESAECIFTWNGVVDWYILNRHGYYFDPKNMVDGMLMEHLVDERLDHGLGDFALREYNDNYKEEFWSKHYSYQEATKETAYEYEMRDGCYTFRAGTKYLTALAGRMDLVRHVHRLQWALFNTEVTGLRVDLSLMQKTKEEMGSRIQGYLPKLREDFDDHCKVWEMEKWMEEIAKRKSDVGRAKVSRPTFSFTSDKQVSWLVYEALELPVISKTKKGNPSTDLETLQTIAKSEPRLKPIVDYKEIKTTYATFVEGMLDRVENDQKIYPSFFINGTTTGRISHGNPNMGNLPREGVIRNFFVPDSGNGIIGADYSQLEVVVEANLTEDPNLLKIINEGISKHDITSEGLGISRDSAKTLNFALQYGAGVHKVSKILSISHSDAQDIFERYWKLYSGVKALKDLVCKQLAETGRVTNLFGRTRHFETPGNEFEKAKQERQAYNHLIQGVGADITNMATYLVADELKSKDLGRLWFSVHDEIVCEVKESLIHEAKECIVKCMEVPNDYLKLKYPVSCKLYGPLAMWSKG